MAEDSSGAPSYLKNLHPLLFMTDPDDNVVIQIQKSSLAAKATHCPWAK